MPRFYKSIIGATASSILLSGSSAPAFAQGVSDGQPKLAPCQPGQFQKNCVPAERLRGHQLAPEKAIRLETFPDDYFDENAFPDDYFDGRPRPGLEGRNDFPNDYFSKAGQ